MSHLLAFVSCQQCVISCSFVACPSVLSTFRCTFQGEGGAPSFPLCSLSPVGFLRVLMPRAHEHVRRGIVIEAGVPSLAHCSSQIRFVTFTYFEGASNGPPLLNMSASIVTQ